MWMDLLYIAVGLSILFIICLAFVLLGACAFIYLVNYQTEKDIRGGTNRFDRMWDRTEERIRVAAKRKASRKYGL